MKWSTWSLVIGLLGLCLAGYQACTLTSGRADLVHAAKDAAESEATRAADEIDAELAGCAADADLLAADLGSGNLDGEDLEVRLQDLVEEHHEILTVGAAFDPLVLGRPHAPAVSRRDESPTSIQIEDRTDYMGPEAFWYHDAIRTGRGWRTPAWSEIDDSVTVMYSAPFRHSDGARPDEPAGVVFVSVSLDRIRERVDELDTGALGWGGVLSAEGHYLAHPNEQRVEDPATLLEVLDAGGDGEYLGVIERALDGERVSLERSDTTTGQTAWFFHEPVEQTGWSVVLVRFEDEVLVTDRSYRRRVMLIAVSAIVGLVGLAIWIAGTVYPRRQGTAVLWAVVAFVSFVLVAGMELVRRVTYDQVSDEDRKAVKLLDEDSLSSHVRSTKALWVSRQETPPVAVPTGILVRTLAFRGAKEVFVAGLVWQKLTDATDPYGGGLVFPDAIEADVEEAYRRPLEDGETVGWRFSATLRQVMDLSRYPLDHDNVSIRILPKGYDSGVLLVPDLASYTMINTHAKPGLEETLELSGWSISGSYFDFKFGNYNTDFGIPDFEAEESLPELHFNIQLKRNVLDSFIASGIPMLVVLLMLFAIIVRRTENTEVSKLFGFNPSGTVRICSALFFVVLLAHIQMRNSIQAEEIVLLEFMYFIVYLAILFTAWHTFLFFSDTELKIVKYKESLITKLLFWPVVLGLQLAVAVVLLF
jgi:hypothetical protein